MNKTTFFKKTGILKISLILFFIGIIAYANAIKHPFVHDEQVFIVNNPYISDLNLKDFFLQTSVRNQAFPLVNTYYRPLLELFNRVIYRVFGLNPAAYHLINILFHIFNGILVFYLLEKICFNNNIFFRERKAFALSVSILFLLHPLQTEAVACISGISNLLFFSLCLLALYLFISSFSYFADIKDRLNKEQSSPNEKDIDPSIPSQKPIKDKKQNAVMYLSEEQILSSPLLSRHINGNGQEAVKGRSILIRKFDKNKYLLSLFVFFVALLAKEQSVILPFLTIFYALCFYKKKRDVLKDWKVFSGYFIVLLAYLLLRKMIFGHSLTSLTIFNSEFFLRILSIPRTLLMYLSIIFIPKGLHYYRNTDMLAPVLAPLVFILLVIGVAVFVIMKIKQPEKRLAIFGFGLFFISLGPTLNIVPLVNEYSLLLTSEHFLYMPLVGVIVLVLTLINSILNRRFAWVKKPVSVISMVLVSVTFLALTIKQNTYWKDEITLFKRTLKYEQNFGRVRELLGKAYYVDGQYEKAIGEYNKSLYIMQGYVNKIKNKNIKKFYLNFIESIYIDIAHCYEALKQNKEVSRYYKKALEIDPGNNNIYDNMGLNFLKEKDISAAIKFYEKALALNKNDLVAANSLAICYTETGNLNKAEEMLRYVVSKAPDSMSAQENLEKFLLKKR